MSDIIATDAQALEIDSGILELYEIEIGSIPLQADGNPETGNNKLYFHSAKDLDASNSEKDIVFDGNTYVAFPILMSGIESKSDGAMARPTLTIANVESILKSNSDFKTQMDITSGTEVWNTEVNGEPVSSSTFKIDDLVGSRVTRRKTFEKYTGSATVYEFPRETYIIDRVSTKNQIFIELELSSPADMSGIQLPSRVVVGKYCPWLYKGWNENEEKSACFWKTSSQIVDTEGVAYSFYFTENDEPLVLESHLASGSNAAANWVTNGSYSQGEYVKHNNLYYRSTVDSNSGQEPVQTGTYQYWEPVRTYTTWSSSTTYNINSSDSRRNDYVKHANTIWKNVRAGNLNITPGTNYAAWVPGDACGKLLKSCKIRYQAVPKVTGTANSAVAVDGIPHADVNTYQTLPFGGFPASRKFN